MNLAEALLNALADHGAGEIFGIPGDFALPFFKVIEESKILPLYTLSHEPSVGFAADATGRVNSTLGVAAVTYGAGALNMVLPNHHFARNGLGKMICRQNDARRRSRGMRTASWKLAASDHSS